jgi:hypothetical protein
MLGSRKQLKHENRVARRSQLARLNNRASGTDKPKTRNPGVYYSSEPAMLKGGARFKHAETPLPNGTWGIPMLPKRKYRPIRGMS